MPMSSSTGRLKPVLLALAMFAAVTPSCCWVVRMPVSATERELETVMAVLGELRHQPPSPAMEVGGAPVTV